MKGRGGRCGAAFGTPEFSMRLALSSAGLAGRAVTFFASGGAATVVISPASGSSPSAATIASISASALAAISAESASNSSSARARAGGLSYRMSGLLRDGAARFGGGAAKLASNV